MPPVSHAAARINPPVPPTKDVAAAFEPAEQTLAAQGPVR
jgi:hypothetical protein